MKVLHCNQGYSSDDSEETYQIRGKNGDINIDLMKNMRSDVVQTSEQGIKLTERVGQPLYSYFKEEVMDYIDAKAQQVSLKMIKK